MTWQIKSRVDEGICVGNRFRERMSSTCMVEIGHGHDVGDEKRADIFRRLLLTFSGVVSSVSHMAKNMNAVVE